MNDVMSKPLYKSRALQELTGPVLRPGGLGLTRESAVKCGLKSGDRVLDVGCGYGAAAEMLAREFSVCSLGLDRDFDMLKGGSDIPAVQAAAQTMPFRSAGFNALFCECVLSLTPDMAATLAEFRRVLQPGGVLVLCDIYLREKEYCGSMKSIPLACGFRKAVGRDEVENLVARAGFDHIIWEDLSPVLTQLAGQAIFDHGSLEKFWAGVFGQDCRAARETCETIKASRPGYFRIIAEKKR
ncbi:MAG: methyltransferase domain-containing protein [Desulfobacteraceae bacterium]|nr:methyltransferase domain-containing protein [Desulfobacteraceae bacterium]